MLRVHKEVYVNHVWEHESCFNMKQIEEEKLFSILDRYCIGTTMLMDEKIGSTLTSLDFKYSKKQIGVIYLLRSDDIFRLRSIWNSYFGDFDSEVGYFLWEGGDIGAFPDEMIEDRHTWGFCDYRMFLWNQ